MNVKNNLEEITFKVLVEKRTKSGKYVLVELGLWQSREWLLYAEQGEEASCVLLPRELYSEAEALLDRMARGELSPIQLKDVVEDEVGVLEGAFL